MTRSPASSLLPLAALLMLGACGGSKPAGSGNVTMRDMEVVDGTANDSMADLDNATTDGTALSNAGGLPGAVPMTGSSESTNASTAAAPAANSSEAAPKEKSGNASASE
ncbi:MAG TPA: hypothetical protein VF475_11950 [Sphingobium sp.]